MDKIAVLIPCYNESKTVKSSRGFSAGASGSGSLCL